MQFSVRFNQQLLVFSTFVNVLGEESELKHL